MPDPTVPLTLDVDTAFGGPAAGYPVGVRATYTFYDPATHAETGQAPYAELLSPGAPLGLRSVLYTWHTAGEPAARLYMAFRFTVGGPYFPWQLMYAILDGYSLPYDGQQLRALMPSLDAIRLKHRLGVVCWEHDGETFTVKSADTPVFETPLPELTATPGTLVGKHPDTGLLAFCPQPVIPAPIAVPPTAPPATPDICVQVRCGVATACVDHLASLYVNWANWINGGLALLGGTVTAVALAILLDPLMIELDIALWAFLRPVLVTLSTSVISAGMGTMTSDKKATLTHALFCQLTCAGDVCALDAGVMVAWSNTLTAEGWPGFDQLESVVLNQLVLRTPLIDWESAAATAGRSDSCDAWTCP